MKKVVLNILLNLIIITEILGLLTGLIIVIVNLFK